MRAVRPVRPAATGTRAPARLAMRVLIATIPLIPWLAYGDASVPGARQHGGDARPEPQPQPDARISPPPPGGMPAPYLPPPPPTRPKRGAK